MKTETDSLINAYGNKELFSCLAREGGHPNFPMPSESDRLESVLVSPGTAANLVMLGSGYFCPMKGFHDKEDTLSICESFHSNDGLFWPIPLLNLVSSATKINVGSVIALRDPNETGKPILAYQKVDSMDRLTEPELNKMAKSIFGTSDRNHPGVINFFSQGDTLLSGETLVMNLSFYERLFPDTFRTAKQIRCEIVERGWQKVVAFQTRNPMHRAHEELCKIAKEEVQADGILIHMLLGKLKDGDIPADVRDRAIRVMVDRYFEPNTVMITGYGFDMLYAGPREALLHAIVRQNAGCTHLIVGRDHAGVGRYYSPFEAQEIFHMNSSAIALDIKVFEADHTAYSKKLKRVVMMRDVKDHSMDDFVLLSGTKVREMLEEGKTLPAEFARAEVAEVLMAYYLDKTN